MENQRTWAEIDLDAAAGNLRRIAAVSRAPVMAVVKANAYGHGAVPLAKLYAENGVKHFAVACVEEAVELRDAGIGGEILILGYTPPALAGELERRRLSQAVFCPEQARELSASGYTIRAHFKADTGMSRIGFPCTGRPAECAAEIARAAALPGLRFCGLFTHFSCADGEKGSDRAFTKLQFERFTAVADALRAGGFDFTAHCCNSAALLRYPEMHLGAVRPGIILYGAGAEHPPISLRPVMTVKSVVSMVKTVPAGTAIGYGRTFVTDRPTAVATLPVGYADGYPRALSNRGVITVNGRRAPVIGRVCMDQIMADVTDIPDVRPGDPAVLFGSGGLSADEVARMAGTISYELFCGISPRVPRVYRQNGTGPV